jgi:hypothetical protein
MHETAIQAVRPAEPGKTTLLAIAVLVALTLWSIADAWWADRRGPS